ncbi:hypothetical protein AVEN_168629-1 [Araneus ventricosus]|uniref:Uncharacterized protein n=1 Tax=Araneus ventricosus TaxID=182803 RepID=A0A4Y2JDW0_ARAVE|nr:hypothetical protein AVEN_168629-1 [Araneus ventricosus]
MNNDDQKEHITQLIVARGRVKASLTRLENTTEDLKLKNEILIRLQRLEEHIKEYEKLDSELSVEHSEIVEFEDRFRNGRIIGSEGQPIAQSTVFGYAVADQIRKDSNSLSYTQSHLIRVENDSNIDSILQQFWQMEEFPFKKSFLSEEAFCETHFKSTYKINEQGRFVVKLPVYRYINQLGDTKGMAVSRLLGMENKFKCDSEFGREYKGFMKEFEEAVQKKDSITTKLRVVFDVSWKPTNSNSLNSVLGVGQVLQPDIFTIRVRFQEHKIALTADIKQMYR